LTDLSKNFGLTVSTVKGILKNKAVILSSVDEGGETEVMEIEEATEPPVTSREAAAALMIL
jgi:hypothetical protein